MKSAILIVSLIVAGIAHGEEDLRNKSFTFSASPIDRQRLEALSSFELLDMIVLTHERDGHYVARLTNEGSTCEIRAFDWEAQQDLTSGIAIQQTLQLKKGRIYINGMGKELQLIRTLSQQIPVSMQCTFNTPEVVGKVFSNSKKSFRNLIERKSNSLSPKVVESQSNKGAA